MSTVGKVVIVLALMVAVAVVVGLKQKTAPSPAPQPAAPRGAEIETPPPASPEDAETVPPAPPEDAEAVPPTPPEDAEAVPPTPKGALPRLVDLGADKCIPCIQMAPILAELKAEYAGQFQVDFIDVWKNPGAAQEHGVQMIPTQIFFDAEGNERFRHVGFFSKEDILATWKELGVDLSTPSQ